MFNIIKKNKSNLIYLAIYTGVIIFLSILNALILPTKISKYLVLILTISLSFVLSYKSGQKRFSKGYLAGIKSSIIIILFLNIIDLLFIRNPYKMTRIIYYVLLSLISILGSIMGINKKAN